MSKAEAERAIEFIDLSVFIYVQRKPQAWAKISRELSVAINKDSILFSPIRRYKKNIGIWIEYRVVLPEEK